MVRKETNFKIYTTAIHKKRFRI